MTTFLPAFPSEYADLFVGKFADAPVSSPFGAWLLPALAGVLGSDAQEQSANMLADQSEGLKVAVAAWDRRLPEFKGWVASRFPRQVQTGQIPSQAGADAWAKRETDGVIGSFPLDVTDPQVVAVLASAVLLETQWLTPLQRVAGASLGGEFGNAVKEALLVRGAYGHSGGVYETRRAGLMCAFSLTGTNGVTVWSGLGEEGVSARDVTFALRDIAEGHAAAVPVASLSEGDHGAFSVVDVQGTYDRVVTAVPAWKVSASFDVKSAPGFPELGSELLGLLSPAAREGSSVDARQSAAAEFDQFGFRAAAVTAMSARMGAAMPRLEQVKEIQLRFGRPFRVLAYGPGSGAWDGVPMFCAGVESPVEPAEERGRWRRG